MVVVCAFDAIGKQKAPEPVWSSSFEQGSFEEGFWKPVSWPQANKLLRAVGGLVDLGRAFRQKMRDGKELSSPLDNLIASTHPSLQRVLQEMLSIGRHNGGAIYPSYEFLAEKTGYSRATVARAIRQLVKLGLVELRRRFRWVEQDGVEGGLLGLARRQASNVYRICELPARLLKYLSWWLRDEGPPAPEDHVWREQQRVAEQEWMLDRLNREDFVQELPFENPELREAMLNFGRAFDQRQAEAEAAQEPEPELPPPASRDRIRPQRQQVPPEYAHYACEVRERQLREQAKQDQAEAEAEAIAAEIEAMFQEMEAEGMVGSRFENTPLALARIDARKAKCFGESHDAIEKGS